MKRLLLPLLAALTLPIAIQAETQFPIDRWMPWDMQGIMEFRFLGCKRGICQKH